MAGYYYLPTPIVGLNMGDNTIVEQGFRGITHLIHHLYAVDDSISDKNLCSSNSIRIWAVRGHIALLCLATALLFVTQAWITNVCHFLAKKDVSMLTIDSWTLQLQCQHDCLIMEVFMETKISEYKMFHENWLLQYVPCRYCLSRSN